MYILLELLFQTSFLNQVFSVFKKFIIQHFLEINDVNWNLQFIRGFNHNDTRMQPENNVPFSREEFVQYISFGNQ